MSPPLHGSLRKGLPAGQPCRAQDVGKLIEGGSAAPESVEGHTSHPRQAAGRPAAPKARGGVGLRSPPASVNIAPVAHDLIISGAGRAGISTAVEAREGGNRARPDPHPGKRTCTLRRDPQVLPGGTIQRWELNVQYDEGAHRPSASTRTGSCSTWPPVKRAAKRRWW